MALISTKNIISPFTNKLHLTSIILVVIAFTILRLSGGKFEFVKEGKTAPFLPKTETRSDTRNDSTNNKNNNGSKSSSLKDLEEMFR